MRNEKVMKKWIEALRSGEYRQGRRRLRQGDRYCCLGVLCDLYAREHPNKTEWKLENGRYSFLGSRGDLPDEVREWAGVEYSGGLVDIVPSLITQNDWETSSFNYIANLIEESCFGNSKKGDDSSYSVHGKASNGDLVEIMRVSHKELE